MSDAQQHRRREDSYAYMLAREDWLPSVVKQSRVDLEGDTLSGSRARKSIDRQFREVISDEERDVLRLVVTELVNNSVEHGMADSEHHVIMYLAIAPERIRAEVCDGGPGFNPAGLIVDSNPLRGFGFHLLDTLTSRLGGLQRRWHLCLVRAGPLRGTLAPHELV
jgi:anti-sigma regulatory factor (Ser/Thr protein kinase)